MSMKKAAPLAKGSAFVELKAKLRLCKKVKKKVKMMNMNIEWKATPSGLRYNHLLKIYFL